MPIFCVYPPGAQFPGEVKPTPTLILATTSLIKARNAARKVDGTVECWADGEPVSSC